MIKNENKNFILIVIFIIIETIFLKFFMVDFLPEKYFLDAQHIIDVMNNNTWTDKSYTFAANVFLKINFLNFTTIKQWGYLISIVFIPIFIMCLTYEKEYSSKLPIFILSSFIIINIYVLGISKDIIQCVFFLFIYFILRTKKLSNFNKLIMTCLILLLEAFLFRIYYAIMAMILVTAYFIYCMFIRNESLKNKQFIKIFILTLVLFFIEVFLVQFFSNYNYSKILNARFSVNKWRTDDLNANTIINDLLGKNNNYLLFMGNYVINFVRLLFPFELVFKGIKQIVFMIYQIFISIMLIKSFTKINDKNCMWILTLLSFVMISTIFEPDFGSFVRHESTIFLIILEVVKICKKEEKI